MSSTMIIAPAASPDSAVYFAKNSNRLPGECQPVVSLPAVENDTESLLSCTYITIPQEPNRHGVLLSKPWWAWGGEMGANDQGMVIGCEPLFSRDGEANPGLIGMDLVRLGLERGRNVRDALEVITSLLQTHGQGGFAGSPSSPAGSNNGFLIADANEVWQLETAGRHWAARLVNDVAALSSDLTIGSDIERYSYACPQYARRKGWLGNDEELDFGRCFRQRGLPFKPDRKQRSVLLAALQALDERSPLEGMMQLARHRVRSHPRSRSRLDMARYARGRNLTQT
ncbi:MAG: C69 family dipeptidase, partial [Candidatus Neomarinimicrobiota bacterium]